ncbi:MAG: hypothetical protein NZ703_11565, partial [Gemmataceae bacterium]|nr:hypothetical protein [Gemmataceae bacterium]
SAFTPVAGYDPERFANQDLPLPIPWLGNLTQRVRSEQEQQLRLLEEYWRPYEQAVLQWQQARSELQTIENNPRYRHAETQLQLQALKHQRSLRLAGTQWQTAIRTWQAWQQARAILLGSIVLLLLAGVVAVWRRWIQPLPWGVGTTGLLALLVLGTILFIQTDRFVQAADVPVVPAESEMANGLACSIAPSVGSDNVGAATPMQPTNPSEAPLLQITNPSAVFNPPSHRPALDNPYGRSGDIQASTLNPVTTPNPPVGTGTIAGRVLSPSGQKVDVKENNAPPLASNKAGQSPPSGGVALLVTGDVQRMGAAPAPPLPMGAGHRPPTMFAPAPKMRENEGRPFGPPPPGGGRRYADAPKFMIHPPFELDGQGKILSESQAPRQATAGIGGAPTTIGSQEKQLIQVTEQRTDRLTGQAARSTRTDELLLRKSGTAEQIIADRQKALEYARQLQDYRRQLLQWGWERHKAAVEHGSRHPDATVSIQDEQAYQRLQQVITVQAVPLVVREYAAPLPTPINEPVDTLLWKPVIVLPKDGQTQIPLVPGNAPGGYDIIVAGHTLDGRLGATRTYLPPHSFQSQPAGVSR